MSARCAAGAPLALLILASCASDDGAPRVWEPRVGLDVLAEGLAAPDDGFALLDDRGSVGRFACALALVRCAVPPDGEAPGPRVVLDEIPHAEQARWVEAFRGRSQVRELVFLRPVCLPADRPDPRTLCATAARFGAPLLLVYLPNRFGSNAAQVLGVLYDAQRAAPIATLQASADFTLPDDDEEPPEERTGDHRDEDAAFQAARQFELRARACVDELIARDAPPPTTQPHRWRTDPLERWWIPRLLQEK